MKEILFDSRTVRIVCFVLTIATAMVIWWLDIWVFGWPPPKKWFQCRIDSDCVWVMGCYEFLSVNVHFRDQLANEITPGPRMNQDYLESFRAPFVDGGGVPFCRHNLNSVCPLSKPALCVDHYCTPRRQELRRFDCSESSVPNKTAAADVRSAHAPEP